MDQTSSFKSYWNNLDHESRKYVIRMYKPTFVDEYMDDWANSSFDELVSAGYSNFLVEAIKKDMQAQENLVKQESTCYHTNVNKNHVLDAGYCRDCGEEF